MATASEGAGNSGPYGAIGLVTVNDAGTVAFSSQPFKEGVSNALYVATPQDVIKELAELDVGPCYPSGSGRENFYVSDLAINQTGSVVATVGSFIDLYPVSSEVTLNGDIQNGVVAPSGVTINGCIISDSTSGHRAINNSGQIVLSADGTCNGLTESMVIVATPVE